PVPRTGIFFVISSAVVFCAPLLWPSSSAQGNHRLSSIARKRSCRRVGTKAPLSYSRRKARDRAVGPGEVRRSIGMRRLPAISLDPMKFLQEFAAGLPAQFADAACAPVPESPVAVMRQLDGDRNEHSGEGREYGTGPTESSSGVDCRGRRRTARVRGEAA